MLIPVSLFRCRRSPHGERGLKLDVFLVLMVSAMSLPTRGAWIEMIILLMSSAISGTSLPTRGAWIEIVEIAYS